MGAKGNSAPWLQVWYQRTEAEPSTGLLPLPVEAEFPVPITWLRLNALCALLLGEGGRVFVQPTPGVAGVGEVAELRWGALPVANRAACPALTAQRVRSVCAVSASTACTMAQACLPARWLAQPRPPALLSCAMQGGGRRALRRHLRRPGGRLCAAGPARRRAVLLRVRRRLRPAGPVCARARRHRGGVPKRRRQAVSGGRGGQGGRPCALGPWRCSMQFNLRGPPYPCRCPPCLLTQDSAPGLTCCHCRVLFQDTAGSVLLYDAVQGELMAPPGFEGALAAAVWDSADAGIVAAVASEGEAWGLAFSACASGTACLPACLFASSGSQLLLKPGRRNGKKEECMPSLEQPCVSCPSPRLAVCRHSARLLPRARLGAGPRPEAGGLPGGAAGRRAPHAARRRADLAPARRYAAQPAAVHAHPPGRGPRTRALQQRQGAAGGARGRRRGGRRRAPRGAPRGALPAGAGAGALWPGPGRRPHAGRPPAAARGGAGCPAVPGA